MIKLNKITNRILFWPCVRESIQYHFSLLLDKEEQRKWFSKTAKHRFWDSLCYYVFDYLLDGTIVLNAQWEAKDAIGVSLYNKEEVRLIEEYLEFYCDTFEGEMPDAYYINHPEWPKLIEGAKAIVEMMEANSKKYNLKADLKEWYSRQDVPGELGERLLREGFEEHVANYRAMLDADKNAE